uniref:ATP-dependent DNA ligase n=1 Tax=Cupriavidus gilardii TaxID=82541 RepID=UPI00247A1897|nr:hypothetical protein [Cupriavidus gilardii]WDE72658.1 hypothetical protein [Cupriavidus gilardii]
MAKHGVDALGVSLNEVEPMLATAANGLPRSGDWSYEVKYDGYRLLASRNQMRTRNGADATRWFPELMPYLASLAGSDHIIDGEVCVLDEFGRSDFNRLHARAARRGWYAGADPVVLCAFDLLVHSGEDIRQAPIEERKRRLQELLHGYTHGLLFVASHDDGDALYRMVVSVKAEGVVAKRAGSKYVAGRSADWRKIVRPGAKKAGAFARDDIGA